MSDLPSAFVSLNRDNIEAYTPKYAIDIVLPYLSKDKIIWAPFSRDEHHYADYLRSLGYRVHNTHYDPKAGVGDDFLTFEPDFEWDVIVDNPPFKGKAKYVRRAFEFGKPFALFLPFNCFGDNGIPKLFMEYEVEPQMLIPDKRTEFENQVSRGISFKTVYICRQLLPKQIIFTHLRKPTRRSSPAVRKKPPPPPSRKPPPSPPKKPQPPPPPPRVK